MKYLFFDIECSNCFQGIGKMCEFGYVLCDENLNVLKSDDIPMSPGKGRDCRFHLKGRKHEKDLELAYEYSYYLEQPEFPHFHKRIKTLVEDPDTVCFAFSMDNDIPHLYNACNRYKLQPFNYTCYDVQKMVAKHLEKKGQMSLHDACMTLVGANAVVKLHEHLSRDDALMEKMIFEAICILQQKDSKTLLDEYSFAKTNSIEYMNRIIQKGKRVEEMKDNHYHYFSLVALDEVLNDPNNKGRRYCVSGEIKKDKNKITAVVDIVKNIKGLLSGRIGQSDYFIVLDEKNKEEILKGLKHPYEGKIITYQEFISMHK